MWSSFQFIIIIMQGLINDYNILLLEQQWSVFGWKYEWLWAWEVQIGGGWRHRRPIRLHAEESHLPRIQHLHSMYMHALLGGGEEELLKQEHTIFVN